LQHSTQVQIRFFITVLQQMARADPMTALLSPAVGGSMQSQMEAKLASMSLKSPGLKSTMPSSPSARNFGSSANPNRQSLAFESPSSFLSPDTTNGVSNSSDAAATLAQQRAKLKASNAAHRISAPALASSAGERTTWAAASSLGQVAERDNSPTQEITIEPKSSRPQSTDFSGIASNPAFRSPRPDGTPAPGNNILDTLSPVVGDNSWASMVNTPLMHMFPKPPAVANNPGPTQTVDLSTKLNDIYGTSTVPRLDGPEKFRRASKGHTSDSGNTSPALPSTATNNNNSMYGDDGDPIQGQGQGVGRVQGSTRGLRNGGGNTWSGAQSPALSNTSGRFGGSDDGSAAMAAAAQQQAALAGLGMGVGSFNLGLGSPALAGMPNGLSVAQLAQLNGMNPFGVNMNMLNMMGITAEAQLLAAQIAAAGGGFGQPGLNVNAGLGTFAGLQGGMGAGQRSGPGRSGGRSPGAGSSKGTTGNGAKKDEDDFDPAVLSDVAGWLRTLRLHKYTPNFEGMTWKEMVVMDEAALEAQGVAALGARRKMLKTFDMVRKKMGIDDPTLPPPPGAFSASTPTSAGSSGTGPPV
jgi:SAM domain (Sterile alpha motif)